MEKPILKIKGMVNRFKTQVVHDHLDLQVFERDIVGLVGGSGSGKTVLLNAVLGLHKPNAGDIRIFGQTQKGGVNPPELAKKIGTLFQSGALFSSLSVYDNIALPMRQLARLPETLIAELVPMKLSLVGLPPETAAKDPAQLSGGMIKRVALARAIALDPPLLFLDEPTAGLDPISAGALDELILSLKENLNLTVLMITHDLESLRAICNRVAVLIDKKLIVGTFEEIERNPHPWIQDYFHSRSLEGESWKQK